MTISERQKKICFVSLGAYPILSGKNIKTILGPDVHQVLLAKELVKSKFNVAIITIEQEGPSIEYFDGIKIIKIRNKGNIYGKIGILIKIFEIFAAMRKENSDIYYQGGSILGIVIPFCKILQKKSIYRIASDALIDQNLISRKIPEFTKSKFSLMFLANWIEIKLADQIVVQNEFQKIAVRKNFTRNAIKIIGPFPKVNIPPKNQANEKNNILWVGTITPVKQPELFIELAESMPWGKFILIGGCPRQDKYYETVKKKSQKISNLHFIGVIPFDQINEYYQNAAVLVNTSIVEGFPNSFFQAWLNEVPVVSLNCDPDDMIKKNHIGFHSQSFDKMINDVTTLLENEEVKGKIKNNLNKLINSELNNEIIVERYKNLFFNLLSNKGK